MNISHKKYKKNLNPKTNVFESEFYISTEI